MGKGTEWGGFPLGYLCTRQCGTRHQVKGWAPTGVSRGALKRRPQPRQGRKAVLREHLLTIREGVLSSIPPFLLPHPPAASRWGRHMAKRKELLFPF